MNDFSQLTGSYINEFARESIVQRAGNEDHLSNYLSSNDLLHDISVRVDASLYLANEPA